MKKKQRIVWGVPIGIIGLFVVFWFVARPEEADISGLQKISTMGNRHIETITSEHEPYNSNPPTSGPHIGAIAPWGVSKEIIPDEMQIHNLEDGGVMVQYNPELLPKDQWKQLEDTVMGIGKKHVIVAPRYDMEYTIVLTAWNTLLPLESIDGTAIQSFIHAYEGIDHHR